MIQIIFFLPLKPVTGSFKSKLKKVDFLGSILMLISTIFILVPISSGGSTFPWSSPVIIVLLVLGGVTLVIFFFVEWRYAALPIVPLHLLSQRSLAAISAITFLAGCYYYANVYFLPIYFQILLEPPTGALLSSALLQSLLLPQIATSLAAGFLVQKYRCCQDFSDFVGWDIIILYYGLDMQFGLLEQVSRPLLHVRQLTLTSLEFCS